MLHAKMPPSNSRPLQRAARFGFRSYHIPKRKDKFRCVAKGLGGRVKYVHFIRKVPYWKVYARIPSAMGSKALTGDPKDDEEPDFGVAVVVLLDLSTLGQRVEFDIREV